MENKTIQYKRTLRGSVGAGVNAIFNGNGRRYYILEHKNSSKYHKAGESQKIIIDQVEIGRGANCQVRFDESFPTVSRHHAAILKDGDRWKLVPLSTTNSTLVNGHPIKSEWFLENGDEIQMSVGGPRMGFIIPAGEKSLVSSIKMTERLELFRKQALRPYKTAITCLGIFLILAIGGLTTWTTIEHNNWVKYQAAAEAQADSLRHGLKNAEEKLIANQAYTDSINNVNAAHSAALATKTMALTSAVGNLIAVNAVADDKELKNILNSVYYIRVEKVNVTTPNGEKMSIDRSAKGYDELFWTGSGFLLDDGRFITARHVVDGCKFINSIKESTLIQLNDIENNGGEVEFIFGAYSPTHSFSFSNKQCIVNPHNDETGILSADYDNDGNDESYTVAIAECGASDWASIHTSFKGSIPTNIPASTSLKQQTKLIVLGYPKGYYVEDVKALQGSCMVASDNLHDGVIVITGRNFEHGNSGGPVLKVDSNGHIEAIGIISAGYGDTVGFIVPLSHVK